MSYSSKQFRIDLRAALLASTAVTDLIGSRLWSVRGEQAGAVPYLILEIVGANDQLAHDGPLGLPEYRVQFTAVARSTSSTDDVKDAVMGVLCPASGLQGLIGTSTKVGYCIIENEIDDYEELSKLNSKTFDFRIRLK
jgi:hypothetical protein